MAYNPNIPLVTDYMVTSQPKIQSNFKTIYSVWSKNHIHINSTGEGREQGMHGPLTFREQVADPTTGANQVALYTKNVSNNPCLFYRPQNNQTPIQMTYPSYLVGLQSSNPDVYFEKQYSYSAGPFVVYSGVISVSNNQIITLLPATTLVYVSVLQWNAAAAGSQNAAATNISGNQFTVRVPPATANPQKICYTALGV